MGKLPPRPHSPSRPSSKNRHVRSLLALARVHRSQALAFLSLNGVSVVSRQLSLTLSGTQARESQEAFGRTQYGVACSDIGEQLSTGTIPSQSCPRPSGQLTVDRSDGWLAIVSWPPDASSLTAFLFLSGFFFHFLGSCRR